MIDVTEGVLPVGSVRTATSDSIIIGVLIVFAILLRLVVQAGAPHLIYADEIFQSIEQAHRLVFGTGLIPWEFQVGIRSWVLPGLLVPSMMLGKLLGSSPDTILFPTRLLLAAASCLPVICGYLWGKRFGDRHSAVIAAVLNAIWVDNIYFSTHALSEVVAGDLLVLALYLGYPGNETPSPRRLFLAGLVFGLTFVLRFHLGPALGVAVLWICGREGRKRWLSLLLGAALPVLAAGLLDWVTWTYPFQSIWLNIWLNVFQKISGDYGEAPNWFYFMAPMYFWGGACALVALTAFIGTYRLPMLMLASFVILATMTLFDHKEFRFIYPAIPLIITLAGLGTADIVQLVWRNYGRKAARLGTLTAIAICFWTTTSLAVGMSPAFLVHWKMGSADIAAFHAVSASPEICGVALYKFKALHLGRSGLPPDVAMYQVDDAQISSQADGFNAIVTESPYLFPDARFRKRACWKDRDDVDETPIHTACLWERPGSCVPHIATPATLPWPKSWNPKALPDSVLRLARHWGSERYQRGLEQPAP